MSALAEQIRITQIALEAHRSDPDDESWKDFKRERDRRDLMWANHVERDREYPC